MDLNIISAEKMSLFDNICQILEQKHPIYQELINSGKCVISFDVKNISSGFGHGSIVYKLCLHFNTTPNDPSRTIITVALKVPTCEISYQQILKINTSLPKNLKKTISQKFAEFHKNECFFYSKVAPFLNIKIPKIYATKNWILEGQEEKGYILMEDLSDVGIVLSKFFFFLEDRIKAVVKEIAHIQAEWIKASLKIDWKEAGGKNVEENWTELTNDFLAYIPAFIDLVNPGDKEKVKNLLNKIMILTGNVDYHIWAFQDGYKELGLPTVLVHGDLWNSNIFFKNNSKNEVLAFVDWQMVYEGSPAADLARYILSVESHVRRKIETTIFSFFIQCINFELPPETDTSFNKSNFRKAYIYSFISEFIKLIIITVNNAKSLQNLIDKNENAAANLAMKDKIILLAIDAMEDVAKFIDEEMADIVARFQKF